MMWRISMASCFILTRRVPLRKMASGLRWFTFVFSVFFISTFLYYTTRINSINVLYNNTPVAYHIALNGEKTDDSPISTPHLRLEVKPDEVKLIKDIHAVFLSKQTSPPFDKDFKNPCWWTGETRGSLACLPYFYLSGFPKSATTDLHYRLLGHPLIARPKFKEPHHLTRTHFKQQMCDNNTAKYVYTSCNIFRYFSNYFRPAASTIQLYKAGKIDNKGPLVPPSLGHQFKYPMITMDSSASTAWDNSNGWHVIRDIPLPDKVVDDAPSIMDWIVHMNPNVRLIMLLREPISRSYSDYNFFSARSKTSPSAFDGLVDKFIDSYGKCRNASHDDYYCATTLSGPGRPEVSIYYCYIQKLLLRVPRDHIYVVRTEDYKNNMTHSLQNIFKFLGLPELPPKYMDQVLTNDKQNVNNRKGEPMWPSTRQKLISFYRPLNAKLAKLLNNDAFLWGDIHKDVQR